MTLKKSILVSFIFLLLVIIAGLAIIAFEKGFFTKKEESIFVSFVGLWDPEIINPLKIEFQRQNPNITIEYEKKDQRLYFETLQNLLSKERPPDIFWWHSGWGPLLKGALASLPAEILSEKDYEKTYYPITKLDAKIGGTYRGIPLEIDGLSLVYNKNLFSSKKLSSPPKTWSELQNIYVPLLTKTDRKKNVLSSAIALGTASNISNFSEIVGLLLLQNGVTFVKEGQINIHQSLAANGDNLGEKAIDFYASFTKKPKVWDSTLPLSIRSFAQGKVAMIILPAYKLPSLQTQIKAAGNKVKLEVAKVPQPPKIVPVNWGSYWLSGVSVKSEHQEEAWKFVKFLSEPENLKKIFQAEKKVRGIGRPYPRIDMARELRKDPLLSPYVAQAPLAKSWYLHSDTFDKVLNDKLIEKLSELITRMVEGKGSTKSNLKNFAEEAQGILQNYGALSPK